MRYFARRPTPLRRVAPISDSGDGATVFSAEKPERLDAPRARCAGELGVEALGQRLHLRELGHARLPRLAPAAAAAPPRLALPL